MLDIILHTFLDSLEKEAAASKWKVPAVSSDHKKRRMAGKIIGGLLGHHLVQSSIGGDLLPLVAAAGGAYAGHKAADRVADKKGILVEKTFDQLRKGQKIHKKFNDIRQEIKAGNKQMKEHYSK